MKKSERRFRTETYQKRQLRLMKQYSWWGWNNFDPIPGRIIGRMRRHSFCDCGIPNCAMCGNPRHTQKELTIEEQSHLEILQYELAELFDTYNNIV